MPRIVVVGHEGYSLGFNSEDVESFNTRRDVSQTPEGKALGKAHLELTFADGAEPTWETKEIQS